MDSDNARGGKSNTAISVTNILKHVHEQGVQDATAGKESRERSFGSLSELTECHEGYESVDYIALKIAEKFPKYGSKLETWRALNKLTTTLAVLVFCASAVIYLFCNLMFTMTVVTDGGLGSETMSPAHFFGAVCDYVFMFGLCVALPSYCAADCVRFILARKLK